MVSLNKNDYNIPTSHKDDGEIYPESQPQVKSGYAAFGSDKPYTEPQPTYAQPQSMPLPEITPVHTAIPQGYMLCNHCEKLVPDGSVFCPACGNPTDGSSREQAQAQIQSQKRCPACGSSNNAESMFCGACGASLNPAQQVYQQPAPQPVIVNNYYTNNVNSGNSVNVNIGKKMKNKWVAFLLCLFLGEIGAHKFYEGKILMGLVYMFTGGLFGVGWVIDTIALLFKPNPYSV
ncbi:MAG: TM2 domain-containing protein [Oscillospiraceae bacterium]